MDEEDDDDDQPDRGVDLENAGGGSSMGSRSRFILTMGSRSRL